MKLRRHTALISIVALLACSRAPLKAPAVAGQPSADQGMVARHDSAQVAQSAAPNEAAPDTVPSAPSSPGQELPQAVSTTTGAVAGSASSPQGTNADVPNTPMMDIEATLAIEVKDVTVTLNELRALVAAAHGQILSESLQDARRERPRANLTLRVASAGALDFLAKLEGTGVVRSRQMTSRDIGKEYFDATLRVKSLEVVLGRYHDLLSKASTIEDTLKLEEHIARISGEIERTKGELRWMRDRVARATIHVELYAKGDWTEPVVTPEAKFYPGLRAVSSWDWRGNVPSQYALGAGLSLRFSRYFSIDFDGLQNTKRTGGQLELALLTLGGEVYSDFLGAGQRRWLNPYLGLRGGYGRVEGNDQFVLGGTVGLELFKSQLMTLSLDLRALGAFGDNLGTHVLLQPALGANFAF